MGIQWMVQEVGVTFFTESHQETYGDVKVQIIDYRDIKNPEWHEDVCIFHLTTLEPNGLNSKPAQK